MNQNRREFLKSIGTVVGFTALLIAMPLVPATRWFQKWFGVEEKKEDPQPVIEPNPAQPLWQTRAFKDRRNRIDYSNNEVPSPPELESVFDPIVDQPEIQWDAQSKHFWVHQHGQTKRYSAEELLSMESLWRSIKI